MTAVKASTRGPSIGAVEGEERFLARYEDCAERLLAELAEACALEREWPSRVWAATLAGLTFLARDPDAARTLLTDAPSAGPRALSRYRALLRRLESMLHEGRHWPSKTGPPPPSTESVLIAGAVGTVADRLRADEPAGLIDLAAPLTEVVLAAYLGAREARQAVAAAIERYSHLRRARETTGSFRPLPTGHHRMPAAEVAADQRRRLLAAAAELAAERGAASITIEQLTARARISRSTFYANFPNTGECVWAAYEDAQLRLWRAGSKAAAEPDWASQVRAAVAAALEFFAAQPSAVYLLGPAGKAADARIAKAQREALIGVVAMLRHGRARSPQAADLPVGTERILIENAATLVQSFLQGEDPERLPTLAPRLTGFLLAPYLGTAEATRLASPQPD